MSRPIRRRAISLFGVLTVLVALVAAAITVQGIVSPKIAAEGPPTRLTIVEASILNTSANTSADLEQENTENTLGDTADEEASGPSATLHGTPEDLNLTGTISDRLLCNDAATVRAAKLAQRMLRNQIELYRQEHNGVNPLSTLMDLTQCTNARGVAGQGFQCGPYLSEIPENPMTKSAAVKPITSDPATTENLTPGGGGWLYNAKTGKIWLDHPDFLAQ